MIQFLCGVMIFTPNLCLEEFTNNALSCQKITGKNIVKQLQGKINLKSRILMHTLNLNLFKRKSFLEGIAS